MSRDSSVGTLTDYRLDDWMIRVWIPVGEFFSLTPCPDQLWDPPSFLSNVYQGLFPSVKSGWGMKLTTHLHLVLRSNNVWSYTSTPTTAFMEWSLVKQRDKFTFYLFTNIIRMLCTLK